MVNEIWLLYTRYILSTRLADYSFEYTDADNLLTLLSFLYNLHHTHHPLSNFYHVTHDTATRCSGFDICTDDPHRPPDKPSVPTS